ncbi:MAG: HAD-IA family hydrolase [Gemmatimonadetes bacterium]|nr:HAD-IA family hydrolase [Gemmatimonadota bacterium]
MTNVILTDLDGVIRIWSPEIHLKAERATGLPEGAILGTAFSDDLLPLVITGQISDDEWRRRIADLLCKDFPEANAERAVELWSASPGEVNSEVLEILRTCRKKAQLALISNATSRLPSDLRRLGIAEDFDYIINSSEVGFTKPDPNIYFTALDTVGATPDQALFIDDNAGHVAAATRLGIAGHTYAGSDGLRQKLNHLRFLP